MIPLVCCTGPAKAVLTAATAVGLVARAELNVRFWRGAVGSFCLEAVRRVRARVLEAILEVSELYGTSQRKMILGGESNQKNFCFVLTLAGPSSACTLLPH